MNYEAEMMAGAQEVRIEALERDLADWKARAEVAEAHGRIAELLLTRRNSQLILRGEWCRRPEKRNDFALLETRTGATTLLIDRAALLLGCIALGLEVKR